MLARTGPSDEPIETPTLSLRITLLKENAVFVQQSFISFFKGFLRNFVLTSSSFNLNSLQYNVDSFMQRDIGK